MSPAADSNLAKLEADTILSSLAASLLPPHLDSSVPEQPVHTSEAGRIIDDFKERPLDVKRWTRVRKGVLVGGSAVWLGVELGRAVLEGDWKGVVFPVSRDNVLQHELTSGLYFCAGVRSPCAVGNPFDDPHNSGTLAIPQHGH